jgi:hypothetical protein
VESIKNHRFYGRRRKLQYLIGWKGYPSADDTWEDADQTFAPDLITQYHHRRPLDKNKRTSSSRRVNIRSVLCLQAIPPSTPLPLPPTPIFPPSLSTRMTSLSTTTAKPSTDSGSRPKPTTRTHHCLSALGLKPWDPSAPHLSRPPQLFPSFRLMEREAQLRQLVTWLDDWLPLSSRVHSSLNASNVSRPPPSSKSETVLSLLLGRRCDDSPRSLKELSPHQRRIYHLIKKARSQQLYHWRLGHGLATAPRMVSSTTRVTSPTSSSPNLPCNEAGPAAPSSPHSSASQPETPPSPRGPPTGPLSTPSRSMPPLKNLRGHRTPFPPGYSPYSIRRPPIMTSLSKPPTERAIGDCRGSSSDTTSSCGICIMPRSESTGGRRSSKPCSRVATAVASVLSARALGVGYNPCDISTTPPTAISKTSHWRSRCP